MTRSTRTQTSRSTLTTLTTEEATSPRELPEPLLDLCRGLEEQGIATWSQGEGLLDDLRPQGTTSRPTDPTGTRSLLCVAGPTELLDALPLAVVTASRARRLTLATRAGTIDLLPIGRVRLEPVLMSFGLGPFAFAFRPTMKRWCDPVGARAAFARGVLELAVASLDSVDRNPFALAPRRYWISARLLSQYRLEPSSTLLEAARRALPDVLERLPQAAPARREISRILASSAPQHGLAFLRKSGVSEALFPGMNPAGESAIESLPPLPALRWAAWLRGAAIQSALVRLRMPPALARRIERIHRSHPIDRQLESPREGGVRKILGRLREEEIAGLFVWRRLELAAAVPTEETRNRLERLDLIETRFRAATQHRELGGQVRALALDGKSVMTAIGMGPGPRVGQALAHLAAFVETHPGSNERGLLEEELRDWAAKKAQTND